MDAGKAELRPPSPVARKHRHRADVLDGGDPDHRSKKRFGPERRMVGEGMIRRIIDSVSDRRVLSP
jgi:hypothetical protein